MFSKFVSKTPTAFNKDANTSCWPNNLCSARLISNSQTTRLRRYEVVSKAFKADLANLNKFVFNKNFICCRESRIEAPNRFYASFYVGPFEESFSLTLAHNLRRTLLSELTGLAIIAVEIDGVLHRFSSMPGVKETTIDILSNLQNIVFKKTQKAPDGFVNLGPEALKKTSIYGHSNTNQKWAEDPTTLVTNQIAYLRTRGPGVVKAADIILPNGIECINPEQQIATLAEDGMLNMRLIITEGKNSIKQKFGSTNEDYNWGFNGSPLDKDSEPSLSSSTHLEAYAPSSSETDFQSSSYESYDSPDLEVSSLGPPALLFLDSVFMPVTKVNAFVETNPKATDIALENSAEYRNTNSNKIQEILESFYAKTFSGQNSLEKVVEATATTGNLVDRTVAEASSEIKTFFKISSPPNETALVPNLDLKETFFQLTPSSAEAFEQPLTNASTKQLSNLSELRFHSIPSATQELYINYVPESTILYNQPKTQCHIVLEIWTNGSIHPRQALEKSLNFLTSTLLTLTNVKQLGSMYKSDLTYKNILKQS